MGSLLNVYVGVYLVIKAKKVPAPSPFVCLDHPDEEFWEVGNKLKYPYCRRCGQRLVQAAPRLRTPCLWDLLPDNDDEFYEVETYGCNEPMIIISNTQSKSKPDHISTGHIDNINIELPPIVMANFTANFLANHEKSIKILRGVSEEVAVKFGVVQYYS